MPSIDRSGSATDVTTRSVHDRRLVRSADHRRSAIPPDQRALVSVYDKTGLEDLVRGLHERRRRAGLHRRLGRAASPTLGLPVTKVEDLTGFPECLDGRVKTLHPQVHAGILADRRSSSPRRAARRARRRAVRPGRRATSTRSRETVASGASARRVRRADRHRRPVDGARRRQEPPERRDRHLARRAYADVLARRSARAASRSTERQRAGRRGVRAHRGVRRRRGVAGWATCSPTPTDGTGFPAWRARRCDARGGAALRREPAPGAPRSTPTARPAGLAQRRAAARQGDVLQQLRRHRRRPAGRARLRPSRRSRSSSTPTRAASPSAPTSPRPTAGRTRATRCRRFGGVIAANRAGDGRRWREQVAEVFTEVIVAPGYERRRRRGAARPRRTSGSCVVPAGWPRRRRDPADLAAACCVQRRVDARRRRA